MKILRFLVWSILSLALVFSGIILMLASDVGQVRWPVATLSALLLIVVFVHLLMRTKLRVYPLPDFLRFYGILVLLAFFTTLINQQLKETVVASKNYFQFLSIPFAMYFFFGDSSAPRKFVHFGIAIALIQPLVAFMQYFMFRGGWFVGDRINGTFGGSLGSPGGNAALAMFLTISISYVLALAIKEQLKWKYALVLSVYFALPIAMTHAKASVIFLLVMLVILFFPLVRKKFSYFLSGSIVGLALLMAVFFYQYQTADEYTGFWNRGVGPESITEFVQRSITYNTEDSDDSRLNRLSAIKFWYEKNSITGNTVGFLFGHGLGSAQESGRIVGHVIKDNGFYGYGIAVTALPRLLWDVGVFGTSCFIFIFFLGFRKATRIRISKYATQEEQAFGAALQVAMVIFALSTVYKLSIVNEQPFSAFVMMQMGILALLVRVVALRRVTERRSRLQKVPPQYRMAEGSLKTG